MVSGEQFVTILGMIMMLRWSVVSLDLGTRVLPCAVQALVKAQIQYGWTMSAARDQKPTSLRVETMDGELRIADTRKMQVSDVEQVRSIEESPVIILFLFM